MDFQCINSHRLWSLALVKVYVNHKYGGRGSEHSDFDGGMIVGTRWAGLLISIHFEVDEQQQKNTSSSTFISQNKKSIIQVMMQRSSQTGFLNKGRPYPLSVQFSVPNKVPSECTISVYCCINICNVSFWTGGKSINASGTMDDFAERRCFVGKYKKGNFFSSLNM